MIAIQVRHGPLPCASTVFAAETVPFLPVQREELGARMLHQRLQFAREHKVKLDRIAQATALKKVESECATAVLSLPFAASPRCRLFSLPFVR